MATDKTTSPPTDVDIEAWRLSAADKLGRVKLGEFDWPRVVLSLIQELENQRIETGRLRTALQEIRCDIIESAGDVVWMRDGIETVVDRITVILGDQDDG